MSFVWDRLHFGKSNRLIALDLYYLCNGNLFVKEKKGEKAMMRKLMVEELGRMSVEEFRAAEKLPVVVVLDNVRSVHNVGSVFRTADAFRLSSRARTPTSYICRKMARRFSTKGRRPTPRPTATTSD